MATNKLFHITAITNLHVGSGKENIGVVDNLIQRDVITNHPIIHSSSLKGALREHCKHNNNENIKYIFGSESRNESTAGNYRFFDAHILALPVRSDKEPYLMATCPAVIKQYLKTAKLFGINITNDFIKSIIYELNDFQPNPESEPQTQDVKKPNPIVFNNSVTGAIIEDLKKTAKLSTYKSLPKIKNIIGTDAPIVVVSDSDFATLCDDNHLPVIARNRLYNGESKNLWYEQVLPRFSVLYFPLIADDKKDEKDNDIYSNFKNCIETGLVQIGANASVGYGFCKLKDVTVETPQPSDK